MLAEGQKLYPNQEYDLFVKDIIPNYDRIVLRDDSTKLIYFHRLLLMDDDGTEYVAQISDKSPEYNMITPGSMVAFKIKSYAAKIYNVTYVKTIRKGGVQEPQREVVDTTPMTLLPRSSAVIRGSAAEIALSLSVNYFQYHEENDNDNIFSRADDMHEWLLNKSKQNNV